MEIFFINLQAGPFSWCRDDEFLADLTAASRPTPPKPKAIGLLMAIPIEPVKAAPNADLSVDFNRRAAVTPIHTQRFEPSWDFACAELSAKDRG